MIYKYICTQSYIIPCFLLDIAAFFLSGPFVKLHICAMVRRLWEMVIHPTMGFLIFWVYDIYIYIYGIYINMTYKYMT